GASRRTSATGTSAPVGTGFSKNVPWSGRTNSPSIAPVAMRVPCRNRASFTRGRLPGRARRRHPVRSQAVTGNTYPHGDDRPRIDPTAYIAPGARIVGDVTIGARASLWFNAVLRGDNDTITIGAETNIQDGAVLHTDEGHPCIVEDACTVGHLAMVHAWRIGAGSLIGMSSIVLTGADIGEESLVAAGA